MKRRELFSAFGEVRPSKCEGPRNGGNRCLEDLIPNAVFTTHENEQVRFYDDILKGRQVLVMMMYADCEMACPAATSRMVRMHHELLGERMGKDLFMCNVTLKPDKDDPAALKAYAEMHGARLPGWTFLTGSMYDVDTLRYLFFSHEHIGIDLNPDLHAGAMRIINEPIGRWMHFNVFGTQKTMLEHIEWIKPTGTLEERLEKNRKLQKEIDREREEYGYRKIA